MGLAMRDVHVPITLGSAKLLRRLQEAGGVMDAATLAAPAFGPNIDDLISHGLVRRGTRVAAHVGGDALRPGAQVTSAAIDTLEVVEEYRDARVFATATAFEAERAASAAFARRAEDAAKSRAAARSRT